MAKLFPTDRAANEWHEMAAAGYTAPAAGFIRRHTNPATFGMPLGGIDTGCLGLDTDSTLGVCSIFNSYVPMRGPLKTPFLGVCAGSKAWIMSTVPFLSNESFYSKSAATPSEIHYWGHYPVADLEYEMPGAPVSVGMRAWSPFLPGDAAASNTPGIVFEVRVRNTTSVPQECRLVFSFPGPTQEEAQVCRGSPRKFATLETAYNKKPPTWVPVAEKEARARATEVEGEITGLHVTTERGTGVGYVIGVVGSEKCRFGRGLGKDANAWSQIATKLPQPGWHNFDRSMAVDVTLAAGEERIVRFILAWYAPIWIGEADHDYRHMYSTRFTDALEVARFLARNHERLLARVLAWQQVLFTEKTLPVWLRESLANILHLFPMCSVWAVSEAPIGDWCRKEDGLFGLLSGLIDWPDMEVVPDSFYGHVPVVLFFPELLLSEMRGHKAYQFPNGAVTWLWGGISSEAKGGYLMTAGTEMCTPSPGFQTVTNGSCYVDMVDRLLERVRAQGPAGEARRIDLMKEFYPSVKSSTIYTMNLRPEDGSDGIISAPTGNVDPYNPRREEGSMLEWWEAMNLYGMVTHIGGIHLAQLVMAGRMAREVGDKEFADQCRAWLAGGSRSMEEKMWDGTHYLLYNEPSTGRKSDLVFNCQLDGDWMAKFHGLPAVFRSDRAATALATVRRLNAALTPFGAADVATPQGGIAEGVGYGAITFFVPEIDMLGCTYMYAGEKEFGLELVRRQQVALNQAWGCTWDQPNVLRGDSGQKILGQHLVQNMILWIVPAAVQGKDLAGFCAPGGLVDRITKAAQG